MQYGTLLKILIVLLVLSSAGCAKLPEVPQPETPPDTPGGTVAQTPATSPTPAVVTPATPYPTPIPAPTVPARPTYRRPPELQPAQNYTPVYTDVFNLKYNTCAWVYTLTDPPLIIELDILPEYVTYTKKVTSQYGSKEEETVTATYISPSSWMEIVVRDQVTGEVLAEDGFNREYSTNLHRKVVVRRGGSLLIELSGNDVEVRLCQKIPAPDSNR